MRASNPLNPPYQGDFERKYVSPKVLKDEDHEA